MRRCYKGTLYVVNKRNKVKLAIYNMTGKSKKKIATKLREYMKYNSDWRYISDDRFYFRVKRSKIK